MTDKVLLTGISGWIAKHIAIELLNTGYEVLGTVRNQSSLEKTKKTLGEHVSIDKLSFVELDLLKDEGWKEAAKDCKYIIHTASPYPMKSSRNREALVPAAKGGTLRVLNAGLEANVEKIVLTSSIAAMFKRPNRTNPYNVGENDWSDTEWSGSNDYIISKTKAEKAAWELMESKGVKDKLTVINPGGVNGGTLRVLNAGLEANVEKIVLTSSIAAMFKRPNRTNPYNVGENDWSDTEWSGSNDYIISKTKAEKAAWELMESKGVKDKLTVINPGGVNGDALDDKENTSTKYVQLFLKGKYPMAPNFGILISDVKDVAKAHVLSLKNSKVNGRRLLIGSEVKKMLEISKIMQEEFPQYAKKLPKKEMPNFMLKLISYLDSSAKIMVPELGILMQTDTTYAEDLLGMKFKPARDSIKDAGNSVIRLGLI